MTTYASTLPIKQLNTDLVIGDERRAGAGRIPVINPSTTEQIETVADGSVEDAQAAVDAAARAAAGWRSTRPRERAEILRRAWELMTDRVDLFAELIALENGKSLADARSETLYAAEFFRWYAEEAVRQIGQISRSPAGDHRILAQYEPIGVAVLVTPWNFPAAMATRKLAPALAAGCTTVLKPATLTPLTAYAVADLLLEAGLPAGVVNVITTTANAAVVSAMLHHRSVRALSFTGSTAVGVQLLHEAADQVLKCSMELGGNAPFIVLGDADLPAAVEAVMVAKMRNGGEACTAANRILVQDTIASEFTTLLAERMSRLRVGAATDPATELGPMVSESAAAGIRSLVEDAVNRGAEVATTASPLPERGYFVAPTVLTNVPAGAEILSEEIFGPVAPVLTFSTDDEAVAMANATPYGLAAYVYGGALGRALSVAERLEAGMIGVNRGLVSDPAAPFGGVKQSGLGREGAKEGLLEFSEIRYIAVSW